MVLRRYGSVDFQNEVLVLLLQFLHVRDGVLRRQVVQFPNLSGQFALQSEFKKFLLREGYHLVPELQYEVLFLSGGSLKEFRFLYFRELRRSQLLPRPEEFVDCALAFEDGVVGVQFLLCRLPFLVGLRLDCRQPVFVIFLRPSVSGERGAFAFRFQ